jgi:hypothetical protein
VSTFVGSSELGRWGNGGAVDRDDWRRSVLDRGVFRCGRGGERDGEWCGMLWGRGSPFLGARGGCRGSEGGVTAGEGGWLQWPSKSAHHGGLRHDLKRGGE